MLPLAIACLSAGVIAYEILLMRLFSIIQWQHFAAMIISLALLGFGASGTFLSLAARRLARHFAAAFGSNAFLFGLTAVASFVLAQRLPFNPLELLWDPAQLFYLALLALWLFFPFFFAANSIGLSLIHFKAQIHRIYSFDLLGAGAGALLMVLGLFALPPSDCLRWLGLLGFLAAALAACSGEPGRGGWRRKEDSHRAQFRARWDTFRRQACPERSRRDPPRLAGIVIFAGGLAITLLWPGPWLELRLSPYKSLRLALQVPDANIEAERSSPLGLLTVVRSPTIPFRHAPGLSLAAQQEPPPQLGLFTDGDSLSVINRFDGNWESVATLDQLTQALPYHLLDRPRVLVLGAGGGSDVLLARAHRAPAIDAVELNPQTVALLKGPYADFSGHLYQVPEVRTFVAEARSFLAGHKVGRAATYDLISVSLLDSFGAAAAGLYALQESYLYTVEAFREYLWHLNPGGFLAITRWLKLPPRDSFRLLATASQALIEEGMLDPHARVLLIRSWKTTTLLIKKGVVTADEIARLKAFAKARTFDLVYYPGMAEAEANVFNRLEGPVFYAGAQVLLGEQAEVFIKGYKFDIAPARDDRPFFFRFFKLKTFPEIVSLRAQGGFSLLEWGYPLLLATLIQAVVFSLALILLPLFFLKGGAPASAPWGSVALYFMALGLAFLFLEMAFLQRFILFLGSPIYAAAVVIAAFLIFAGLGSRGSVPIAVRWGGDRPDRWARGVRLAVGGIILGGGVLLFLLPIIFERAIGWPFILKVLLSVGLIAPMAFAMGMPFPLGLAHTAQRFSTFIPWAWGLNGCASVLSAVLATLLAVHFGFTVVIAAALGLYIVAALALYRVPAGSL